MCTLTTNPAVDGSAICAGCRVLGSGLKYTIIIIVMMVHYHLFIIIIQRSRFSCLGRFEFLFTVHCSDLRSGCGPTQEIQPQTLKNYDLEPQPSCNALEVEVWEEGCTDRSTSYGIPHPRIYGVNVTIFQYKPKKRITNY